MYYKVFVFDKLNAGKPERKDDLYLVDQIRIYKLGSL